MFAAKVFQLRLAPVVKSSVPILRSTLNYQSVNSPKLEIIRTFTQDSRDRLTHAARRSKTLKEQIFAPAGETAFNVGKGALAGGAVLGLGALCYYGLGLSNESGAIDHAIVWPQYVKDRIKATYSYFGGSIIISVASAAAVFRTPALINFFAKPGFLPLIVSMGAMIGSGMLVRSIPYEKGFGPKQLAWVAHSALIGAVVAPMAFLGGQILIRAAWYTAGVVGGLSVVAACAPSEKFLMMGGPLAIGFGVVFASSLGSMFLPPTSALGAGLYSIALYGGLLLFSGFLLYDTQRIVRVAETHPPNAMRQYDPIAMSLSIYMDAVNIFIRIATILAGGGNKRR